MKHKSLSLMILFAALLFGCDKAAVTEPEVAPEIGSAIAEKSVAAGIVQSHLEELLVFQPAGEVHSIDEGGNVVLCSEDHPCPLVPGTLFPPADGNHSVLDRQSDKLRYRISTNGLPPGAYTNWWIIFNHPEFCEGGPELCNGDDLFLNPDVNGTVFWATGGIVKDDGIGKFRARIHADEVPQEEGQLIFGDGLEPGQAEAAVVHLVVKYHGPPSDDPDVLYDQTHTLLGHCDQGVNGVIADNGSLQCFDPQFVAHVPDS